MKHETEYERGYNAALDDANEKIEALIDKYVAQWRRGCGDWAIGYACNLWANLARPGSDYPSHRFPDDAEERAEIAAFAAEEDV